MNQQVKTGLGVAVIVIIAATAAFFTWKVQKNKQVNNQGLENIQVQTNIVKNNPAKSTQQKQSVADETVNWNIYTNEKYNFSFKHPADLNVVGDEISNKLQGTEIIDNYPGHTVFNAVIANEKTDVIKTGIINNGIAIDIRKNENNNPFFPESQYKIISREETLIENQETTKIVYEDTIYGRSEGDPDIKTTNTIYVAEKDGYIYYIQSFGYEEKFKKIINNIISTFKFNK